VVGKIVFLARDCSIQSAVKWTESLRVMGDAGEPPAGSQDPSLPSAHPTQSFWQTSHVNNTTNYRSTPELPKEAKVVVIGSGITGVFAARELVSSSEHDVLVLEARTTCSGATGRNGGHLQPLVHEQDPNVINFELQNFQHIADLIEKFNIRCDFRKVKGVIGFYNKIFFGEAKQQLAEFEKTAPPEYRGLVQLIEDEAELENLQLKGAVGAIVQSVAASLSPYKLVTWLWERMLRANPALNLQTNTAVTSLRPSKPGEWLVHTDRGAVATSHIIIAANGYSSYLLPQFSDLITPVSATMSALKPPPSFSNTLLPNSFGFMGVGNQDRVQSDYLVQAPISTGGHMMYGGGRQTQTNFGVGVTDDSYVDGATEQYLASNLPKLLNLSTPEKEGLQSAAIWTGIIGHSRDHFPWVGRVPDMDGVYLAAGYSGHGMPNAALCGRYVADLVLRAIDGNEMSEDVDWEREAEDDDAEGKVTMVPEEYKITKQRITEAKQLKADYGEGEPIGKSEEEDEKVLTGTW